MKDKTRARERFLRDPLPARLGGISASLARISSSARSEGGGASVAEMIQEVKYYIEWTAAEAELEVAAELVDIQVGLALWQSALQRAGGFPAQRSLLAWQAKKWSDAILAASGLLG